MNKMNVDKIIPYGKEFYPTLKEMENFKEYVYKISKEESNGPNGAIKVFL